MSFKFEKLVAWQKAVDLPELMHAVSKSFPEYRRRLNKSSLYLNLNDFSILHCVQISGLLPASIRPGKGKL